MTSVCLGACGHAARGEVDRPSRADGAVPRQVFETMLAAPPHDRLEPIAARQSAMLWLPYEEIWPHLSSSDLTRCDE